MQIGIFLIQIIMSLFQRKNLVLLVLHKLLDFILQRLELLWLSSF